MRAFLPAVCLVVASASASAQGVLRRVTIGAGADAGVVTGAAATNDRGFGLTFSYEFAPRWSAAVQMAWADPDRNDPSVGTRFGVLDGLVRYRVPAAIARVELFALAGVSSRSDAGVAVTPGGPRPLNRTRVLPGVGAAINFWPVAHVGLSASAVYRSDGPPHIDVGLVFAPGSRAP
jgi:hypothetical protein